MEKTIEIPEGYEARIEGNKVILERKESEDEIIRRRLINLIKELAAAKLPIATGGYFVDGQDKDYIAYLERQKSVQDREEREYVRTLKSLIADFLRGKDEIDREYYQKIYDWLDGRHIERQLSTAEDIAVAYQMGLAEGRKEQKPAEDKDAIEVTPKQDYSGLTEFERAIHRGFLCAGVENVPVGIIKDTAQDCLAHIKPAEWSEEDSPYYDDICEILINLLYSETADVNKDAVQKDLDWLKSLRPSWKPSEEQILAIVEALKYLPNNKEEWIILENLIDDLQKLL